MTLKFSLLGNGWILVLLIALLATVVYSCKSYKIKKGHIVTASSHVIYGSYMQQTFRLGNKKLHFNIIYPEKFDDTKTYPVLLFLHGAGERGDDNTSQLVHGGELIKNGANTHDVIAILPQCPEEEYWIDVLESPKRANGIRNFDPDVMGYASPPLQMVMSLLKTFLENDYVDKSRVYVAGLSMGGMGTFDLCWRMPNTFAAASAICGAGSPKKAADFKDLPMRIYHGDEDEVVSVEESIEMIEALRKAGGKPEVFIYEGVNHNSWDKAFAEPDFLTWMFKHTRE